MRGQSTVVPAELARSSPRPVRLTAAGRFVTGLAIVLAAGAAAVFMGLLGVASAQQARAASFAAEGRTIAAEITSVRRADGSQRRVQYRYEVDGVAHRGAARLRQRDGLAVGDRLAVVYLPDRPAEHYLAARGYRAMPVWVVPIAPLVLLVGAALAWGAVRSQRQLLESGRGVLASVTGSTKQKHQHGSHFVVNYEFRLLNGSTRRGSYVVEKDPPAPGSSVVIVYDRDRPARNKRYPISLVRVETGW